MSLRFRRRLSLGPLRINLSGSGVSFGVKAGPLTYNLTRRRLWANLPGPFYWAGSARRHPTGTYEHHPLSRTRCVCGARIRPQPAQQPPREVPIVAGAVTADTRRGDIVDINGFDFTAGEAMPAGTIVAVHPEDGRIYRAQPGDM